jgi:DNA-binding PucR family transcriptional regulator
MARAQGDAASYRDLITLEGLLEQQPAERLAPFVEATVAKLADYDRVHRTMLVATLRQFRSSSVTLAETAASMYIHPNSLRYRLRTIEELTGMDPRRFHDRVALNIGLWAWDHRPPGTRAAATTHRSPVREAPSRVWPNRS